MINITSSDINLVLQHHQVRYVKLQVLNREKRSIGTIYGRLVSGNTSIDSSSHIQRTASIVIETESAYLYTPTGEISLDLQRDMPANHYIKLWCGVEDNDDLSTAWYSQGVYIIAQSSYNFDASTRTLSVSLVDLMSDLNGERSGELHAYTSLVKNQQRIDTTIENVLEVAGIKNYSIEYIAALRSINMPFKPIIYDPAQQGDSSNITEENPDECMIPYDLSFQAGVTAYEILDKLVGLYPYYTMGFDAHGMFFARKEALEQDDSLVILDYTVLQKLTISEDVSIDWNYIKNHIEVWGKDGMYYGEAEDTNTESPYQIGAIPTRRLVVKDNDYGIDTNSICDRYLDTEKAETLLKEQAELEATIADLKMKDNLTDEEKDMLDDAVEDLAVNKAETEKNIDIKGDDLAEQFAKRILYDRTRLQDSINITTILLPFVNDVDFKVSYRSHVDNIVRTYVVKSVNHDFGACTTTFNLVRFYSSQCSAMWETLGTPVITNSQVTDLTITLTLDSVPYAETYELYVDGMLAGKYQSTTIVYEFPVEGEGIHSVYVTASAEMYKTSDASGSVSVEVHPSRTFIVTDTNKYITTNTGLKLYVGDGTN